MSEVTYEEHPDVVWTEAGPEEVSVTVAPIDRITTAPTSWPAPHKAQLDRPGTGGICRCWRCSGAMISLMERGPLDRILARHLLRMTESERDDWLGRWYQVPNHGPQDIRTLQAWMDIEQRKRIAEPTYLPRRAG